MYARQWKVLKVRLSREIIQDSALEQIHAFFSGVIAFKNKKKLVAEQLL